MDAVEGLETEMQTDLGTGSRTLQHKSTDSLYCQSQSTQQVGQHLL